MLWHFFSRLHDVLAPEEERKKTRSRVNQFAAELWRQSVPGKDFVVGRIKPRAVTELNDLHRLGL
jgi:hypothetical protein